MSRTMDDPAPATLDTPESLQDFALGDDYALNPRYISLVVDAADRNDQARLAELLAALRPADVADLMGFLQADYRDDVLAQLAPDVLAEVLPELDDQIREDVLEDLTPARLAAAVAELDSDDAAAVVEDLDEDRRNAVLAAMPMAERLAVESSLSHEEETAGRLMQREVVAAPQFWTVGHAIDHMRAAPEELPDQFFDIYVVDPAFQPVGAVPLATLLKARRETPLSELMSPVTEIGLRQDQEEVAYVFEKYNLISAPVVDESGRLVGQITVDDIMSIVQEENQEDILALAGVSDEGRDRGLLGVSRSRLPWLAVNLGTAILSASVITQFQDSIAQLVALAVLMPIVSGIGGNAGTQALTVTVRALALRELSQANARRTFIRELGVGLLNGLVLAPIMALVTAVYFQAPRLGLVIGSAMVLNLLVAALVGVLVPMTLSRLRFDPAVSSAVFVTATTDFFGFLIFLGLATMLLLG